MKQSGLHSSKDQSDLMAILWKDDSHKLMNVHSPPTEGNFCDEQGSSVKSLVEI
jgi:hypothetical protein